MNLPNKQKLAVLLLVIAGVLGLSALSNNTSNTDRSDNQSQAQAQTEEESETDKEEAASEEAKEDKKDEEESKTSSQSTDTFSYVAQRNDSYSKLARKAIQTYGINNNVNLSQAQIIYAETMLTQEAGSPLLRESQQVTINESAVKSWVDKAGQLSDGAKKAWEVYTVGVNFNTDNVGQSR